MLEGLPPPKPPQNSPGSGEPKNTFARRALAARLKHNRNIPYEQKGTIKLSPLAARKVGKLELSIGESTLEFREAQMGVDFVREIKRIIERKRERGEKNSPVRVLDVGAARSTFLSQLKKRFGRELEAHSVDIRFFPPESPEKKGVEQHVFHVEGLSKILPENYFDMIVDCRGGILWTRDREKGLSEIYTVLRPGSSAYVFPKPPRGIKNVFNGSWIEKWAEEEGAQINLSETSEKRSIRMGRTLKITKPEEIGGK